MLAIILLIVVIGPIVLFHRKQEETFDQYPFMLAIPPIICAFCGYALITQYMKYETIDTFYLIAFIPSVYSSIVCLIMAVHRHYK